MESILELKNLTTGYKSRTSETIVTADINAELYRGELVCLIGPNGAGKSTLMRTISGSQKPIKGEVFLDRVDIYSIPAKALAKKLSVVLTERVNAGMLSAYEVISLGRYPHTNWSGRLNVEDHRIINEAIEMTGARELVQRSLSELSDGERQKIMIARAFAQEPEMMILDEVTAFLDLPRRVEIMKLLRNMASQSGKSILLSTHDMDLALRGSDRIWLLPKDGSLHIGSPEDLVLNGSFEAAFESEGVNFDKQSGSFNIHNEYKKSVALNGDGNDSIWTERALMRNGISVDPLAQTVVTVHSDKEKQRWSISSNDKTDEYESIYELIRGLTVTIQNK